MPLWHFCWWSFSGDFTKKEIVSAGLPEYLTEEKTEIIYKRWEKKLSVLVILLGTTLLLIIKYISIGKTEKKFISFFTIFNIVILFISTLNLIRII